MGAVDDIVIAINEVDQVFDVASSETILEHVSGHLRTDSQVANENGDPIEARVIEFFNQDGEELLLVVCNSWHELKFIPSGDRTGIEELRYRMEVILNLRFDAIGEEPATLAVPTEPDWHAFLAACAALVAGDGIEPPSTIAAPPNPKGWFHNTFVHGGNP
jgi:hypothetical protein